MSNETYRRYSDRYAPGSRQLYNAYAVETVTISGSISDQDMSTTSTLFEKVSSAGYIGVSAGAAVEMKLNSVNNDSLSVDTTLTLDSFYIDAIYVTNSGAETTADITLYGWK